MDRITNRSLKIFPQTLLIILMLAGVLASTRADQTNAAIAPAAAAMDTNSPAAAISVPTVAANNMATSNVDESLRSNLQVQEELHNTQLAIEKYRETAEATATSNSQALDERLGAMEKALASQQLEELKGRERSERMILIASGVFAAVGFLVLLIAAYLQLTAVNRLATVASNFATRAAQPLALGEAQMLPSHALQQSTASFLTIIERLEQRIHDLEGVGKAQSLPEGVLNGSEKSEHSNQSSLDESLSGSPDEKEHFVNVLLNKVQTLLKLDKPEAALACLDEVLAIDPGNADALVKKGSALERMQRFDEAIEFYDRAIARDNSMTMAYLYKGGVFNRLERYGEALACYEQALKTRQSGHAANVIID